MPARNDEASTPRRRAALIATALSIPIVVLLAFAFTAGRGADSPESPGSTAGAPLPAVTVAAIPANPAADAACAKVFAQLPVRLGQLAVRRTESQSQYVSAWGDPAVVLRCGVGRPAALAPNASDLVYDIGTGEGRTVEWLARQVPGGTYLTSIDRPVYVEVFIPGSFSAAGPMPELSRAIATALVPICQAQPNPYPTDPSPQLQKTLCVYRR